jgi:multiple sugar transport system permease protein
MKSKQKLGESENYLSVVIIMPVLVALVISGIVGRFLWTADQTHNVGSPIWPAQVMVWRYNDEVYPIYRVPTVDGIRELVLVVRGRTGNLQFLEPNNPEAGLIHWEGSWRTLEYLWEPIWSSIGIIGSVFGITYILLAFTLRWGISRKKKQGF